MSMVKAGFGRTDNGKRKLVVLVVHPIFLFRGWLILHIRGLVSIPFPLWIKRWDYRIFEFWWFGVRSGH